MEKKILVELDLFALSSVDSAEPLQAMPDGPAAVHYKVLPQQCRLLQSWYASQVQRVLFPSSSAVASDAVEEPPTLSDTCKAHSPSAPDQSQNPGDLPATSISSVAKAPPGTEVGRDRNVPLTTHTTTRTSGVRRNTVQSRSSVARARADPVQRTDSPMAAASTRSSLAEESIPGVKRISSGTQKLTPLRSIVVKKPPRQSSFYVGSSQGLWPMIMGQSDKPAAVGQEASDSQQAGLTSDEVPPGGSGVSTGGHLRLGGSATALTAILDPSERFSSDNKDLPEGSPTHEGTSKPI